LYKSVDTIVGSKGLQIAKGQSESLKGRQYNDKK